MNNTKRMEVCLQFLSTKLQVPKKSIGVLVKKGEVNLGHIVLIRLKQDYLVFIRF